MASISVEKNKKYCAVHYTMVDGTRKHVWETFTTKKAKAHNSTVENKINDGTFIPPNKQTIR